MAETPLPLTASSPTRPPSARRRLAGRWWIVALLAVAILLVLARPLLLPRIPARAHPVDRGEVVRDVFGRGTLESRREVQLGFDLSGRVSDILVDEGDRVKLGQVLAHLAPEQFSADVRTARSAASQATAAISRLDAEEKRAEAALQFARTEAARMRALAPAGTVSTRDVDLAEQQLALAKAELERVRASRVEAHQQIAVAGGTLQAKDVTAARAVLVAPFDGVVLRRLRDPGDTVTLGTTVLRVVATDALWSRASIDESALPLLQEGQRARVRLGTEGAPSLLARVDRIGREVDRQTHELLVDVLLPSGPPRVAIGQRADVWIEVERRPDVVRVPVAYLRHDAAGDHCLVDRGGRIRRAPVQIGLRGSDLVEIVAGLASGDVVLDPGPRGGDVEGRRWAREGT
jgi:HlyD family secretion protein